ncbi:MAG TPA: LysR substrate-binding domain-containing protein [Streptosporangiaceae bacterium]|nr:LysR substrate-binding domain-containing protein [Streptosporangiaceae bacterium]
MTLNQLRTFLAVAESGSVRAAAQELVVTQAAVSASVAALQKSLGVALVSPDGRGLRLTDAGTSYARYARRILGLLDEAGRAAAAAADPERGELRIAAVTTAAEQIVPAILGGFRQRHPQTGVRLEAGNRDRVRSLLDRHQVDLVLTGRPDPTWDVAVHGVRPHQLVVVASPDLAAAARAGSGGDPAGLLPWLARQTWLLREPGSGTRASTDALLADLDITPLTLMVGSNVAIRESAQVGLGVTLLSRDAVLAELAAGQLAEIPVPGTPLHRDWYLVAHLGRLPPAAARLVTHALHDGGFRHPAPADSTASA